MELDPKLQDKLHSGLAEELFRRLHAGPCATCGRSTAGPQELTVIRQFLSDNGITSSLRSRSPLHRLAEAQNMPFAEPDEQVTRPSKRTA